MRWGIIKNEIKEKQKTFIIKKTRVLKGRRAYKTGYGCDTDVSNKLAQIRTYGNIILAWQSLGLRVIVRYDRTHSCDLTYNYVLKFSSFILGEGNEN